MSRSQWPAWVRVGLWSIHSRSTALTYMVVCLGVALASIALGFGLGAFFFGAAAWYWFALRWVDRNATWDAS